MSHLDPLKPGETIDGRYLVRDVLGEGGYGLVYEAEQTSTGQRVAIKVLHPARLGRATDARVAVARFEREMQVIGQLQHPHIVRLVDSGRLDDGGLYSVLEYIDGVTLAVALERDGALEPRMAKRIMTQVADALTCAHDLGIVHRDLKPQNIMICGSGLRRSAMVLDFGIAAIAEASRDADYQTLTATGQVHGTPAYMAPEQLRDRLVTPQTDIYAWGLVMIEALTARRAFKSSSYASIIYQQMSPEPVPIPVEVLRHPLGSIVARAVAKPLDDRFASAAQLLEALDGVDASVQVRPIKTEPGGEMAVAATVPDLSGSGAALDTDEVAGPGDGIDPGGATWSIGDTAAVADVEAVPADAAPRRRLWLVVGVGVAVLSLVAVLAGLMTAPEGRAEADGDVTPEPVPAQESGPGEPPADDLEIPTSASNRVERLAWSGRSSAGSTPDGVPPSESPGGTGPILPLASLETPVVAPTTDIALERLRLDLYFNSNKLHIATYDLVNTSSEPRRVAVGVPVELVCRIDPPGPCLRPSETEHTIKVDGERVEGRLVGPLSGDRRLGDARPEGFELDAIETVAAVGGKLARASAERFGYDYLYVFELDLAPGQRRSVRDHFPRSGTVEGVAPTLGFALSGGATWAGGEIGELEVRIDFGGPTSHCLFANLAASMRGRRLAIDVRRPDPGTPVVVRWVQPETLIDAELARHPGLALRTRQPDSVDAEALDALLQSKGDQPLQSLYEALLLAYRGREVDGPIDCRPVSLAALTDEGRLVQVSTRVDDALSTSDLDPVAGLLVERIGGELERRGLRPPPRPSQR